MFCENYTSLLLFLTELRTKKKKKPVIVVHVHVFSTFYPNYRVNYNENQKKPLISTPTRSKLFLKRCYT